MEEFDEPIYLPLHNGREAATVMFGLGIGAHALIDERRLKGAVAASNLQVRLASEDPEALADALGDYAYGGRLFGEGEVSSSAAIAKLASQEESDPEDVTEDLR